jgi:hypothetical protein
MVRSGARTNYQKNMMVDGRSRGDAERIQLGGEGSGGINEDKRKSSGGCLPTAKEEFTTPQAH